MGAAYRKIAATAPAATQLMTPSMPTAVAKAPFLGLAVPEPLAAADEWLAETEALEEAEDLDSRTRYQNTVKN